VAAAPVPEVGPYVSAQYGDGQLTAFTNVAYSTRPNANGVQYTSDLTKETEQGTESLTLRLDLAIPPNATPAAPQPLIIWIHGGGFRQGGKEDGVAEALTYARAGYVAATINYRLTPDNDANPTVRTMAITHACEDAMNAIRYLKANAGVYHIDPLRIATIGSSAGGGISLINGIDADTLPQTASDFPGISAHVAAAISTGATLVDSVTNANPNLSYEASDAPVLLFHA
jgi:acetyl esterase/lipase